MTSAEVTIRGAGILGLSVAWACARRGARVRVIDPAGIGAGASGGLVGALAPFAPEMWNPLKAFQLQSLLMAGGWWNAVERMGGGQSGYRRSGRLQPIANETAMQFANDRAEAAKTLWPEAMHWRIIPASGAEWEPYSPSGYLIHDNMSARIAPRAALQALAAAIRSAGSEIAGAGPDEGAVVHAKGLAGLGELSVAFGTMVGNGQKGQALLLRYPAGECPQIYTDGVHIVPQPGGMVAVGSTSERYWQREGPDAQLDSLLARARSLLPALARAPVVERWAGIRPRARSRKPILGPWPGRPGHFIANGGFKTGFGMAPLAAESLAALILENRDEIPDMFRPEALLG